MHGMMRRLRPRILGMCGCECVRVSCAGRTLAIHTMEDQLLKPDKRAKKIDSGVFNMIILGVLDGSSFFFFCSRKTTYCSMRVPGWSHVKKMTIQ